MYGGTGVSRGVRRTTWERSLKIWELQIPCFEEFLGGENVLGLVPASLLHTLGYACTFYAPTSPPPKKGLPGPSAPWPPERLQKVFPGLRLQILAPSSTSPKTIPDIATLPDFDFPIFSNFSSSSRADRPHVHIFSSCSAAFLRCFSFNLQHARALIRMSDMHWVWRNLGWLALSGMALGAAHKKFLRVLNLPDNRGPSRAFFFFFFFWDPGGHGEESNRPNCPKVVRGECERWFGAPVRKCRKSLLHRCERGLHWCEQGLHRCERLFLDFRTGAPNHL